MASTAPSVQSRAPRQQQGNWSEYYNNQEVIILEDSEDEDAPKPPEHAHQDHHQTSPVGSYRTHTTTPTTISTRPTRPEDAHKPSLAPYHHRHSTASSQQHLGHAQTQPFPPLSAAAPPIDGQQLRHGDLHPVRSSYQAPLSNVRHAEVEEKPASKRRRTSPTAGMLSHSFPHHPNGSAPYNRILPHASHASHSHSHSMPQNQLPVVPSSQRLYQHYPHSHAHAYSVSNAALSPALTQPSHLPPIASTHAPSVSQAAMNGLLLPLPETTTAPSRSRHLPAVHSYPSRLSGQAPIPGQHPGTKPVMPPPTTSDTLATVHPVPGHAAAVPNHYPYQQQHTSRYGHVPNYAPPTANSTNTTTTTASTAAVSTIAAPLSALTSSDRNKIANTQIADPRAGQKRKRSARHAPIGSTTTEETKRREQEAALAHYFPPPRPPIRAKDVYVKVVNDSTTAEKKVVDDKDGHYIINPDTYISDRYRIVRLLGQGTFGKVVEAVDLRTKTHCAVKVIRAIQKYRDASKIELRVLSTLASNDSSNRNKCIHLRDCFDYRNHICIVTDLYGQSVFDFLKGNGFVPFPSSHIQKFAHQLLTSVAFLHDLNLIHTDLKPENILLVDNSYQTFTYNRAIPSSSTTISRTSRSRKVLLSPEIRLIDFGSATFDDEFHSSVVSTRHYRAPEIILELGWSYPCDMWSVACILVEFYTGDALFQTHDNLEHLAMMEPVCNSPIEPELIRAAVKPGRAGSSGVAASYFRSGQRLNYPNMETTKTSRHYVNAMKRLHEFIPPVTSFNRQFLDLLRRLFVYDPKKRMTAKDALRHPWFKETIVDDGTEAERIRERRLMH